MTKNHATHPACDGYEALLRTSQSTSLQSGKDEIHSQLFCGHKSTVLSECAGMSAQLGHTEPAMQALSLAWSLHIASVLQILVVS